MEHQLTEGALQRIMNGEKVPEPIIQVLGSKRINSNNLSKDRYRLMLSDGKEYITFAMLTTQATVGTIERFSIIRLKNYIISDINNVNKAPTKVLLIIDTDILVEGGQQIGNPALLSDKAGTGTASTSNEVSSSTSETRTSSAHTESSNSVAPALNQSISDLKMVNPIAALTPYHNKWVIKARVFNKSDMRTWSNSRGEGKLFNVDLVDESGEIRCTAFRDIADKYYNYLQVDKVYYISKCQLKAANKHFSTLKNDYEMTMSSETIIEECVNDDGQLPQVRYNFVTLDAIGAVPVESIIDVIGICKEAGDVQAFTSRANNRELKKREVCLVDQSKTAVSLTLWGAQAESFEAANNPVVVIKGAKVGEFGGGKTISVLMSSVLKCNPDIPECHRIKGWYETEGRGADVKNISERIGSGNFNAAWMTLQEVQDEGLGRADRGDYFQLVGTILMMRCENAVYKACPTPDCKKKVIDLENGMYRCEKCDREYPNFKYRLLVSMNVGDWTNNQWVSLFSAEAEKILSKSSQEIGLALENDPDGANKFFQDANFKQFVLKCRTKLETYNDEERLKTVVVNVDPVNYEEHNNYLIGLIQKNLAQD